MLAVESDLPGHEVFYVASPDTIGGHPLEEVVRRHHGATQVEIRPLAAPGRLGDRLLEGAARCSAGSRSARGATTSTSDGRLKPGVVAAVVTRRLGSRRTRDHGARAWARWAMGGPWRVRLGTGRRRGVDRRDPARGRAGRQLGRHRAVVRRRPCRGGRRPRARAVPCRRGRARVHEVRPARGSGRPRISFDLRPSRSARSASRACGGSESSGSTCTSSTGRTTAPARRWRSRGQAMVELVRTRGRCAGSASATSPSSSSSAARRSGTSTRSSRPSPCSTGMPARRWSRGAASTARG